MTISPLASLDEPDGLKRLSKMISDLLPPVDLSEVAAQINAHTGFADEFSMLVKPVPELMICPSASGAVLMAEACNIGLEPLIRSNVPALTRHRLNWTKRTICGLKLSPALMPDWLIFRQRATLAQEYGVEEVASADGMRFVTPVRTINAGPNRKYFGNNVRITVQLLCPISIPAFMASLYRGR
ncbi:Tn3 family transposase [Escherichia coli]|uniref:Tn3 family transposase n=1 Tax=Escherichia coli TaxID=562 RepID=UPI00388E223B